MGIILSLMLAVLVIAGGAAVDFTRAAQVKSMLQSLVDAAATSGATAYVSSVAASIASTVATNYMNNGIATLSLNGGVTFSVQTGTTSANGSTTGYTVTVTASAQPPTTLLSMFEPSLTTSVTATAINPIATATVDFGNFTSSACDGNTIYWYAVPSDNSSPSNAALTQLYTNTSHGSAGPTSFQTAASQRIGFAMQNVTGQNCGYGANSYGSAQGSNRYFYSHLNPPSAIAYPQVTQNCNVQVTTVSATASNAAMPPPPSTGTCFSGTPAAAIPSCAMIGSRILGFYWSAMGGMADIRSYSDGQYTFSCSLSNGGTPTVALTQ